MTYKIESLKNIKNQYNNYFENHKIENDLSKEDQEIRNFFVSEYNKLKEKGFSKFDLDLELGFKLYNFIRSKEYFTREIESNYNFWRTVAVFDIPDIIEDRFGIDKIDHFYRKGGRVYPYSLYWFIHSGWQGDEEKTRDVLSQYTTDEIVQIVERPSRIGINLDLYRSILKRYVSKDLDKRKKEIKKKTNNSLIRAILAKNTAKLLIYRPEIYPGGVDNYVEMLFKEEK